MYHFSLPFMSLLRRVIFIGDFDAISLVLFSALTFKMYLKRENND